MPSLLDLRRRIRAVKSTQQITKAMKMISASKLRRAQDRVIGARPYAQQMDRVLNSVASRVDPLLHPLLVEREEGAGSKTLLIVVTADKGLCGGFNTNIIKAASTYIVGTRNAAVELGLVGRKGRDFFKRRGFPVAFEEIGIFQKVQYGDAKRIADAAVEAFVSGRVDKVVIIYNEFKSVMQQRVTTEQLLPIPKSAVTGAAADTTVPASPRAIDSIYEPEPAQILGSLLPKHIEIQIYRALLESAAAEHAARMTAMDAATKNSKELIDGLTLYMNKVRQAAITREIIEVVSGAQAL
jgi:F-type H+-transporting ATPase subunit gamma